MYTKYKLDAKDKHTRKPSDTKTNDRETSYNADSATGTEPRLNIGNTSSLSANGSVASAILLATMMLSPLLIAPVVSAGVAGGLGGGVAGGLGGGVGGGVAGGLGGAGNPVNRTRIGRSAGGVARRTRSARSVDDISVANKAFVPEYPYHFNNTDCPIPEKIQIETLSGVDNYYWYMPPGLPKFAQDSKKVENQLNSTTNALGDIACSINSLAELLNLPPIMNSTLLQPRDIADCYRNFKYPPGRKKVCDPNPTDKVPGNLTKWMNDIRDVINTQLGQMKQIVDDMPYLRGIVDSHVLTKVTNETLPKSGYPSNKPDNCGYRNYDVNERDEIQKYLNNSADLVNTEAELLKSLILPYKILSNAKITPIKELIKKTVNDILIEEGFSQIGKNLDNVKNELAKLDNTTETLENQKKIISNITTSLNDTRPKLEAMQKNITSLQSQLDSISSNHQEATNITTNLTSLYQSLHNISDIFTQLKLDKNTTDTFDEEIKSANQEIDNITSNITDLTTDITNLTTSDRSLANNLSEITKFLGKAVELTKLFNITESKSKQLEEKAKSEEVSQLLHSKNITKLYDVFGVIEFAKQIQGLKEIANKTENNLDVAQKMLEHLESQQIIEKINRTINEAINKNFDKDKSDLQKELETLETLDANSTDLNTKLNSLEDKLKDLQEKFKQAYESYIALEKQARQRKHKVDTNNIMTYIQIITTALLMITTVKSIYNLVQNIKKKCCEPNKNTVLKSTESTKDPNIFKLNIIHKSTFNETDDLKDPNNTNKITTSDAQAEPTCPKEQTGSRKTVDSQDFMSVPSQSVTPAFNRKQSQPEKSQPEKSQPEIKYIAS